MNCPVCHQAAIKEKQYPFEYITINEKFTCPPHFWYYQKVEDQQMFCFGVNIIYDDNSFLQYSWGKGRRRPADITLYSEAPSIRFPPPEEYLSPEEAYSLLKRYDKLLAFS